MTPVLLQASVATVQLWVSGILAVLRVLVSQSTEDIVLSRVHELSLSPHLLSCHTIRRLHQQSPCPNDPPAADTLGNGETNGDAQKAPPEETFARLVFFCLFSCKHLGVKHTRFITANDPPPHTQTCTLSHLMSDSISLQVPPPTGRSVAG